MDYSTYRDLMFPTRKMIPIPHYLYPCHNFISFEAVKKISEHLNDPEELTVLKKPKEFFQKFPFYQPFDHKVHLCYPLYCGSQLKDMAKDMLNKKLKWEKKLSSIKITDIDYAVKTIKALKKKEDPYIPKKLNRYLLHLKKDPEPNFNGNYNWMYTGGNLASVKINGDIILLGADRKNSSNLLNVFNLNFEEDIKLDLKKMFIVNEGSPILSLCAKPKQDELLIIVRQKNVMSLFKIDDIDQCLFIDLLWKKKIDHSELWTSADINANCSEVVFSNTKSEVCTYNIESKRKIYNYKCDFIKKEKWSQVMFIDNLIYLADRSSCIALDSRDPHYNLVLKCCPNLYSCENICSVTSSCLDSNYLYLGTTHHLVQIDCRNGKSVQKWTHLMKNPPQFLKCSLSEENDFLILQSHQMHETIGIINSRLSESKNNLFRSSCFPKALTVMKDALRAARLKGLCLNPKVPERLDFSVTGIELLEKKKEEIGLLTLNSGGDIFCSQIRRCRDDIDSLHTDSEVLKKMSEYENSLEALWSDNISRKQHVQSNDLEKVKTNLKGFSQINKRKKSKFHWKCSEMYSEKSLIMYQDVMAQKILKIWGISAEEPEVNLPTSSELKVEEWMANI